MIAWLDRRDLMVRGHKIVHTHAEGGAVTDGRVLLREVRMEEWDPTVSGEPIILRVAACERCGAILAVVSVART
jgi:hypothetical protein